MGYEEVWNVLEDLITELRNKRLPIPANIMNDLHSAKTLMQVYKVDHSHTENLPRIEAYLENVEAKLISIVQEKIGTQFSIKWMKKIDEARKVCERKETEFLRFVPGIPRGRHWVRVRILEHIPQLEVEKIAEENGLSCKMQKDGYMLVYGDDENVKTFVKKLASKFRGKKR